jgi:hypothetical protein
MTNIPPSEAPSTGEKVVDTTPVSEDRTAVTYGILVVVGFALVGYLVARGLRGH